MTLYTLTMVMVEYEEPHNYERGVFTSLDKAKEGAELLIKKCESENVPEIFICKIESDTVTEPVGIIGWLKDDDGKYFKYFDLSEKKTLADKIKDGDELTEIERKLACNFI